MADEFNATESTEKQGNPVTSYLIDYLSLFHRKRSKKSEELTLSLSRDRCIHLAS